MSIRIYVQVWCELDPALNYRIDRQSGLPQVDDGDVLKRICPVGRMGVSSALRQPNAEVTAFALGDTHDEALYHALASGAKNAVRICVDDTLGLVNMMEGLAVWLAAQGPDLVHSAAWGGQVAAKLGWAHLAGLNELQYQGRELHAFRQLGRGAFEKVTATLPAIIRLQSDAARPEYISRSRIAKARKRDLPIDHLDLSKCKAVSGVEPGPLQVARPRTRLSTAPVSGASVKAADRLNALMGLGTRIQAKSIVPAPEPEAQTAEQMAEDIVRYLAHHQFLK